MERQQSDMTSLLKQVGRGDSAAKGRLIETLFRELRGIAHGLLSREREQHILQPTALVHEVFLKLIDQTAISLKDTAHFNAIAARSMRQILVDYARSEAAAKRGGGFRRVTLTGVTICEAAMGFTAVDLMTLDDAMISLAELDERKARVVELRFFGGQSVEETANVLGVAPRTVKTYWATAKLWLFRAMNGH